MATSTILISQLTLATPEAADSVAGANAAGQARRFVIGEFGTAHTHAIAQVTGLQSALDAKAPASATNALTVSTLNGLNGAVTIEQDTGITVSTQGSKITVRGLSPTAFAPVAHTHTIANVSGLQAALDAKGDLAATNVPRVVSLQGVSNTITIVGVNLTVATAAGQITLTAAAPGSGGGGGDVASVNNQTGTVVLTSSDVSAASAVHTHVPGDITGLVTYVAEQATAANVVRSLNGLTGAVVITHTSVSAAATSHTHSADDITSGTLNVARIPTHTHTIAEVSGLQTSLDGKAGTAHATQHRAGGVDVLLPVVTSATITASANNLTLPTGDIIRLTSSTAGTAVITGLSGGVEGAVRVLANVATNSIRLVHAGTASDSTNRFAISGGADLTLGEGAQASAWYDADSDVWRVTAGVASGAAPTATGGGIVSVNGQTATAVVLVAADVSAASAVHTHTTAQVTGLAAYVAEQATNAAVVLSLGGITGPITLTGVNLTVATAAGSITLTAAEPGGGGGGGIVSVNGQTATAITLTAESVTAASTSHATTHRAGGSDVIVPQITSVSLTASVNDYTLPVAEIIRLSHTNTVTVEITGFASAVDGTARLLRNVSTGANATYTLRHRNTNSTAANRIDTSLNGFDCVISSNGGAQLVIYQTADTAWCVY